MSDGGQKKRKSKGWYKKQAFHNKRFKTDGKPGHRLVAGLKGFIVTCNEHEKDAVKESYNILNEYADKLYGPEAKEEAGGNEESDGDDIEAAIAKEVQNLKDTATKGERRFQNSLTGAKNCIFIKTTLADPAGLAHAIFTDLLQTKVQKCRYALRLLPVVGTCKANLKDINELAKVVLQSFFTEKKLEVTYAINFKARNNNGVGREMTISSLRNTITEAFPSVLLRYTPVNPQITILVEVMCGVACIAVAREFARFRKYNLVEVVNEKQTHAATNSDGKGTTENESALSEKVADPATVEENSECHQQQKQTETIGKAGSCDGDSDPISTTVQETGMEHEAAISSQPESSCPVPSAADRDDAGKSETPQEVCGCTTNLAAQDSDALLHKEMLDCLAKPKVAEHEAGEAAAPSPVKALDSTSVEGELN